MSKSFGDIVLPHAKALKIRNSLLKNLKKCFKPRKQNTAAEHYDIEINVITKVYDKNKYPLFKIFTEQLQGKNFSRF